MSAHSKDKYLHKRGSSQIIQPSLFTTILSLLAEEGRKPFILYSPPTFFSALDLIFQFSDLHLNYLRNGERSQRGRRDDIVSVEVPPPSLITLENKQETAMWGHGL